MSFLCLHKNKRYGACDDVEQDSTMGPNFALRLFFPHRILLGSAFPKPCSVPQSGSDTANADFQFSKNEGGTEWQKPTTHRNATTS